MNTVTKWGIGMAIALVALVAIVPFAVNTWIDSKIKVPPVDPVDVVWVNQNWTPEEWQWWYHVPQGSAFEAVIPYDWFIALEQPRLDPLLRAVPPLIDPTFMAGFGFLSDGPRPDNPDALPVGFAKTENFWNPINNQTNDVIGFTCAACHTGQINFRGKGIRTEGGPAVTDVNKFKAATGLALFLTELDPFRFNRFAQNVLGNNATPAAKTALKAELKTLVSGAKEQQDLTGKFYPPEGFARLDALDRIDNFVFGAQLNLDNYRVADAPVSYPHIWSSPWFDWVQYNGSVMQPMTRNAGEAMGVFSRVQLDPNAPEAERYRSNVDVVNLYKIEKLIAKDSIFTGLAAPQWPENILGPIDTEKAAKGKELYQKNCQQCHLPPMDSEQFMADDNWTTLAYMDPNYLPKLETMNPEYYQALVEQDPKYLKVTMKNLYDIGTDPTTAKNWYESTINMETLMDQPRSIQGPDYFDEHGIVRAGQALPFVVKQTANKRYEDLGIPPEQWAEYDGGRPNLARSPLAYKARPLNGIWATPPFLHNGSVPNLYEILVPDEKRTKTFYVGSKEFDPTVVGYETRDLPGGTLIDTTLPGNLNNGHSFEEGKGPGIIGRELSEEERWALVEYLKTL
ncbi:MAG: cytochrome c [Leptolyngbyaceae bacterium]|nr:cytochrome c [Leptolyngbyaceae bacterium]